MEKGTQLRLLLRHFWAPGRAIPDMEGASTELGSGIHPLALALANYHISAVGDAAPGPAP